MRTENPNYRPETLSYVLRDWAQAVRHGADAADALAGGIEDGEELMVSLAAERFDELATQIERAAKALRELRQHTKYPPEDRIAEVTRTLKPVPLPDDVCAWAVSGDNGYSIKIVGGEFTARRMAQILGPKSRLYSHPTMRAVDAQQGILRVDAGSYGVGQEIPGGWKQRIKS